MDKMSKPSLTIIADLTCCAICLESFTVPKVLPCQHTYCYRCLLSLCPNEKQAKITCPQCREKHDIPKGGISAFRDNIIAKSLLEVSFPKEVPCSDCKLKCSVSACEHCNVNVCASCLVEHIKLSMELKMSLNDVKACMTMSKSHVDKERLKRSREDWSKQLELLKIFRNQKLRELAIFFHVSNSWLSFMEIIGRVYDEMIRPSDTVEVDKSYLASLSQKTGQCTTIEGLKDLRNKVSDLKSVVHLLQNTDDDFWFVRAQGTEALGRIDIGQAILNVRGSYGSEVSADEVFELFPGIRDRVESESKSPAPLTICDRCQGNMAHVSTERAESSNSYLWHEEPRKCTADEVVHSGDFQTDEGAQGSRTGDAMDYLMQALANQPTLCNPAFVPSQFMWNSQVSPQEEQIMPNRERMESVSSRMPEPASRQILESDFTHLVEPVTNLRESHVHQISENDLLAASWQQQASTSQSLVQRYCQNQLPKNVKYSNEHREDWIRIMGRDENHRDASELFTYPQGVAYHVGTDEVFLTVFEQNFVLVCTSDGLNRRIFYNVSSPRDVAISSDGQFIYRVAHK